MTWTCYCYKGISFLAVDKTNLSELSEKFSEPSEKVFLAIIAVASTELRKLCQSQSLFFEVLLKSFELQDTVFNENLQTESFDIGIAFTELSELGHSQSCEKSLQSET